MAEKKTASKFFETKYFGLVIGVAVFALLFALSAGTVLVKNIEQTLLDLNFRLKNTVTGTQEQRGVNVVVRSPRISPDLLIVGIDDKALDRFGRWPFPRFRHADLVNSLARIKDQAARENALFIDVFFSEISETPEDDALLVSSIRKNGRVFLETVLAPGQNSSQTEEQFFSRQDTLYSRMGTLTNIKGDWLKVTTFFGLEAPPLKPYAAATYGYGHANFLSDSDQVYRRQALVAKLSQLVKEIPLEELTTSEQVDAAAFEHLSWMDKNNVMHEIPSPLTQKTINDLKGVLPRSAPPYVVPKTDTEPEKTIYLVRKYKDTFLPSITLALALNYMNRKMSDIEVVLGKYIRIPSPQKFNVESGQWEAYTLIVTPAKYDAEGTVTAAATLRTVPEVRIPIDLTGAMLINFMGEPSSANPEEHQTYPVRSYAGYASNPPSPDPAKWPPTKKLDNIIVMVGPFSKGMAADEKPTPFGLMYGVEMHANALNTILMGNFLTYASPWLNTLILFAIVMLVSLMVSRLSTIWSLVVTIAAIVIYFFASMLIFEYLDYIITFSAPAIGAFLAFLAVVAYRTVFEERDKRRIRDMFSKYVSPTVVDEILQNPPELGGVDKNLTVFFSDIRGFTTMSEGMTAQELVNHLNQYLTAMTDLILEYEGTLDKYVGDEVMCFWGAPIPQADHALLACKCALRQVEVLDSMNKAWPPEKRLSIGIGLNTGTMTVANMGSTGRMNYTLMGDNVNLGARLEGTNKQYSSTIIISESTYAAVKDKVIARDLDIIRVKGKNKPVQIYELIDVVDGLEPPVKVDAKGRALAGSRA
jgi:adenylate cyclase